jgi:hypothetical protein
MEERLEDGAGMSWQIFHERGRGAAALIRRIMEETANRPDSTATA